MQQILKERLIGKHDLNLEGLTPTEMTKEKWKAFKDPKQYEEYRIPYPRGTTDYFRYSIFQERKTGGIWILKMGGIASVTELYEVPKKE